MAGTFPRYRLYESDGTTLVYEFVYVLDDNGVFSDPQDSVEIGGLRGQGSIIIPGSQEPFDITLTFLLKGTDYADLVSQMASVISSIDQFTRYVLKVDISLSTTQDYNVQRIKTIQWPLDFNQKRVNLQKGIITFRSETWSL